MRDSEAEADRWLRQARNDLDFAQVALREGFFAQACFFSHQIAEKALKALAYHRGDRIVFGHSLSELMVRLSESYPQLSKLGSLAGTLDQYYVPTRYPDALPGSAPFEVYGHVQAEEAVKGAEKVVAIAAGVIGQ
ncbi:MAG: HEPN domain-containing protein [Chloroflexi bacterium]|nr:HEPN domain-containing protein [Chloroflexota bacterium]